VADKLTRKQLAIITHNDPRAMRALEDLFNQAMDSSPTDLTVLEARVTATEIVANTAYGWGNHAGAGYLTDAPSDGILYARKDGTWEEVSVEIKFDDNERLYFGTGNDSAIWYDGIDMYIDPAVVGAGRIVTNDASVYLGESGVIYSNKLCAV